ncbi:MAG TPA: hypothetical protein PKW33_18785 [Anaerolineaceae bacterium]|nr:hypothetical protein [Anaerolineaceae bacterium]HPN53649.1 hypothetical protein [Anaerolineaceae bacterium]
MGHPDPRSLTCLRRYLAAALALFGVALIERLPLAYGRGSLLGFSGSILLRLAPAALLALLAGGLLWLSFKAPQKTAARFEAIQPPLARLSWLRWPLLAALAAVFPLLQSSPLQAVLDPYVPPLWLLGQLALLGAWLMPVPLDMGSALALAFFAAAYRAVLHLPEISDFPGSLGWSEGSRYYNASTFWSALVYGQTLPLPTLHPTRYFMQSLPFIIPGLPLWFHRLWQVLLWLITNGTAAWLLARRLHLPARRLTLLAAAWAFLFFYQGPIYYHLMVCGILVLWGFDSQKMTRSTIVVILASIWAGLSRLNWFPLPAALAVLLYVLERPCARQSFIRYWLWPVVWCLGGTGTALAAQFAYAAASGNPLSEFGSSLSSDKLWYRLFPSAVFGPGILNAAILVSVPVVLILLWGTLRGLRAWHPLRQAAVWAVLAAFFAGGLVVSVKIGGGSNLHNLDAYLLLLAVAGAYVISHAFIPDNPSASAGWRLSWAFIGLAVLVAAGQTAALPLAFPQNDPAPVQGELAQLQPLLDEAGAENASVLFITQRHLIPFGYVRHVRMVNDYEKVFLMEMSMANNRPYLDRFQNDLRTHRFKYIIAEPVQTTMQDKTDIFGEENNAWVQAVNIPLSQTYQRRLWLPALQIEVLEPRP